ncbi:tyrosine-protein phosphatase non-receptor type substrate 1-like [Mauremys mutica]|uniref:tyrosine-protein phosphatase non-receptor type substrate 1-like n=1 Tax=Mauremys mutica TaxID=74926 RepID=UPI001D15E4C1|nr:tyrosine-protein phosphatase non-receptor type substrate 1-like [Mauremys mutica]
MATLWGRRAGPMGLGGLLLPLLVLGVAGSRLQLVTDPSSRALLGSGTLVKCRFDAGGPVDLSSLRVQWYLWEERIAQYDQGRGESQVRGSLSEQELENGNASLWLSSVTVSDMGLYKCVVGYRTEQLQGETTLRVLGGTVTLAEQVPAHARVPVSQLNTDRDGAGIGLAHLWVNIAGTFGSFARKWKSGDYSRQEVPWNSGSWVSERGVFELTAAPRLSVPRKAGVLNAATSFPCHVWGFYPGDVTVTWLRDGQVLTDATRSAPERNPDGTFNLTLTYTFTPTASDSGSIFSCHVSHAALVQPLREEFPLAVTGADHTSAAIGATLGILVAGGAAAAIAIYCWRKRREGRGPPYSVSEVLGPARCLLGQEVTLSCAMEGTFPKDTAVTWERIHGEDRTVIRTDGVSEAGEGPEHQPLLHAQPPGWRATQERSPCKERSGTCLAASLSFTPTVQDDGARVRCSFHHKSRGIREQRESGEIQLWGECPQHRR